MQKGADGAKKLTAFELFNALQHQSNWPSGGAPAVFDLRASSKRIVRGSHRAHLDGDEVEVAGTSSRSWRGRDICLVDASPDGLADHPVARALLKGGACRELFVLSEPFDAFYEQFPCLCAKESSSKASKRPLLPSCILPNLLYLGDLSDAAALPRLRDQLNIQMCLTALAELPPSLKSAIVRDLMRPRTPVSTPPAVEPRWCLSRVHRRRRAASRTSGAMCVTSRRPTSRSTLRRRTRRSRSPGRVGQQSSSTALAASRARPGGCRKKTMSAVSSLTCVFHLCL